MGGGTGLRRDGCKHAAGSLDGCMQPQAVYIPPGVLVPVVRLKSPLILSAKLKQDGARGTRLALVSFLLVVGSAVAVYNADSLYLAGDRGLTAQLPSTLAPGANNTILVLTTDASGDPEPDQPYTIDVMINNTSIANVAGVTDSRGMAAPAVYVPPFRGEAVLVIRSGGSVLSRSVTPYAVSRVFLTTDKPIYQPGQVVHARLLVLRQDLWATPMEAGAEATFEVKTPDGDRVLRKNAELDEFGVISFDYPLSDQLPLGDYQLKAIVAGFETVRTVKVDEYVLPRFEISFGELQRWYTYDDDVDAYALVKYFFGETVPGTASLDINLFDGTDWRLVTTIGPGALEDGAFEFTYDLGDLMVDYWEKNYDYFNEWEVREGSYDRPDAATVEFNLSVTDTGGHTEHDSQLVTVAKGPIVLTALTDVNVEGQASTYYVIARYPDGMPVPGAGLKWHIVLAEGDGTKQMPATTTDERGVAVLTFEYKQGYGAMEVAVSKEDRNATERFDFKASQGIKAVSDKPRYAVGDVATFDVFHAGDPASDLLYYDVVADGFTIATGHVSMPGDRATVRIPVTSDFGALTSVRFYKIERNFRIARDVATIGVVKDGGDLDITITPDLSTYLPQDDVSLEIEVMRHGVGIPAMLGVSIVDNAVFELGARFTGFEEVLAGLGPYYSDPYYQLMGYILVGDGALPSQGAREWDREKAAPVDSTGYELNAKAGAFKDDAIMAWWVVLGSAAVVGLVAILAMGQRTRHWKAILAVLTLAIAPTLAVWGTVSNLDTASDGGENGGDALANDDPFAPPREAGKDAAMEGSGIPPLPDIFPGRGTGDTDGLPDIEESYGNGGSAPPKRGVVRQFFPETWAWVPVLPTDDSGVATLDLVAPDSITSWDVSVIASTEDALVGVAHQNVTIFQEFFVEPDLPAKAFLGDRFPLRVQVYNYGEPTAVEVRLAPASWFSIEGVDHAELQIATGEVGYVEFTITMLEVGVHEVSVTGESATFIDTVMRPLRVKPAGEHLTDMFQGRLTGGNATTHELTLVPELIANSQNAWVKLQGGVEAAIIDGAEGFINYVSGCGEQSLSTLSIDVLAFRSVREGDLDEAKLMELEAIVNQGIQHELQYLLEANNKQGRGIVWFPGDEDVHPWLTAWGVITFKDAQLALFSVDDSIITDMQSWLKSQQKDDGSFVFPEWGIYEYNNPKLRSKTLATTAYVAHALIYSGVAVTDPKVVKAAEYVVDNIQEAENWADPYTLALGLKLLADTGEGTGTLASRIADKLHELRTEDNGTTSWASATNMISNEKFAVDIEPWDMWNRNPGFVIETTGYAAQALYASGRHLGDVEGAVKFLIEHRNELGCWYSTQDTVVAFQSVYYVSERRTDVDMGIEVLVDGELAFEQSFDASNSDMTYLFDLRPLLGTVTTEVELRATGTGFIMYQVFLEQWVPWDGIDYVPLELQVDYASNVVVVGGELRATAHLTNRQDAPMKMALIELVAPVGMSLDASWFEALLRDGVVDNVEWLDGAVRLYVNDLEAGEAVSFDYELVGDMPADVTLAGNRAFDMYNSLIATELGPIEISIYVP